MWLEQGGIAPSGVASPPRPGLTPALAVRRRSIARAPGVGGTVTAPRTRRASRSLRTFRPSRSVSADCCPAPMSRRWQDRTWVLSRPDVAHPPRDGWRDRCQPPGVRPAGGDPTSDPLVPPPQRRSEPLVDTRTQSKAANVVIAVAGLCWLATVLVAAIDWDGAVSGRAFAVGAIAAAASVAAVIVNSRQLAGGIKVVVISVARAPQQAYWRGYQDRGTDTRPGGGDDDTPDLMSIGY